MPSASARRPTICARSIRAPSLEPLRGCHPNERTTRAARRRQAPDRPWAAAHLLPCEFPRAGAAADQTLRRHRRLHDRDGGRDDLLGLALRPHLAVVVVLWR